MEQFLLFKQCLGIIDLGVAARAKKVLVMEKLGDLFGFSLRFVMMVGATLLKVIQMEI